MTSKIANLNLGKKKGRPRKNLKKFSFFELKGRRKRLKAKKIYANEGLSYQTSEKKDLASEVLDTGILMGLIPLKDRNKALQDIRSRLSESQ